jgi:tricorn protease
MYREAWRLQRDHFWTEDMSGIDWQAIYKRYLPLVDRIATRAEFSDLMWEMQGELGTSHAYEFGGDYPPEPAYLQGFLGADLEYDADTDSYRVAHIVRGDVWNERSGSPLCRAGVGVREGDRILAVGGRAVGRDASPAARLVYQAGTEVLLKVVRDTPSDAAPVRVSDSGSDASDVGDGDVRGGGEKGNGSGNGNGDKQVPKPRMVTVKTLRDETDARYREWVDGNRSAVHEATGGRVGYVHVPDMSARGYAEFHRGFLAEVAREGLIVDARFNGGGHVSQLILEKLARRRLGYDTQRWGDPIPYPYESVMGPIVALCNELAGSDGDIFSHAFKMMGLGPLIGKRTWGGVIGINMRNSLVDGGMTTQPEYSFWFQDIEWGLENYGTEPDIEVEIRPQDYVAGTDPQLERAITEILGALEADPPVVPDFGGRPRLGLPTLPD